MLIIHKMAMRILLSQGTPRRHGLGVVALVLNDFHAACTQTQLLPRLGIGRHMHHGLEAQGRSHDANRQAQIAGGTYRHLVLSKHGACSIRGQMQIVATGQQAVLLRDLFGVFQHLMHATTGLDRACHRQAVVGLDPHLPHGLRQAQRLLHLRHCQQV